MGYTIADMNGFLYIAGNIILNNEAIIAKISSLNSETNLKFILTLIADEFAVTGDIYMLVDTILTISVLANPSTSVSTIASVSAGTLAPNDDYSLDLDFIYDFEQNQSITMLSKASKIFQIETI